jgi:hypothetical protein
MKKDVGTVDATPSKRLFYSIIADYDLNRAMCELIDNALDIWIKNGKTAHMTVQIDFDKEQQTIRISDNAGGVRKEELHVIVGPGHTSNVDTEEIIGYFGVGTKRAVVALAQDVKITTRYGKNKTYRVEFDENWLQTEGWELPTYEVSDIAEESTVIELQKLRFQITNEVISRLEEHLRSTYARFLTSEKLSIRLGTTQLTPSVYENWTYPPDYEPKEYAGPINTGDGDIVDAEIIAGLSKESSPTTGEYGVYFYCNDRLIARAIKDHNVGFTKGLAGLPDPEVSLVRVIVSLDGTARSMPWNSSKSAINPTHPTFVALRDFLVKLVMHYASLSRRWKGQWEEKVFKYPEGEIVRFPVYSFPEARKLYLPELPKSRPRYGELMVKENREIVKEKPWAKGLYEAIIAVDAIFKQKLEQKNRICLILLDSTLEIAFKEFLVNESGHNYDDGTLLTLFNSRWNVHKEVQKYANFKDELWKNIEHFYRLRCKLVHERVTVGISDDQVGDYREVVEKVLRSLFKLSFSNAS